MSEFTPKEIHKASQYLQERLDSSLKKNEHLIKSKEEKNSFLKQFVNSLLKR